MVSDTNSPQVQLALDYLTALENVDVDKVASYVSDDFYHQMLPKSFGGEKKSKSEMIDAIRPVLPTFKSLKFTVHETVETTEKVVFHASSTGESKLGNAYENEYVFIFHFSKAPTGALKISFMKEFIDSRSMEQYIIKEQKAAGLAN